MGRTTTRCEHGIRIIDDCEQCIDEQETLDDQATDDDWQDWMEDA